MTIPATPEKEPVNPKILPELVMQIETRCSHTEARLEYIAQIVREIREAQEKQLTRDKPSPEK